MPNNAPTFLTLKQLKTTNKLFNLSNIQKLEMLFNGGWSIGENADTILPRLGVEVSKQDYNMRTKSAAFIPYLSDFIIQLGSTLHSEPIEIHEPTDKNDTSTPGMKSKFPNIWKKFGNDCDGCGTPFNSFMNKWVFREANHHDRIWIKYDLQYSENSPTSLYEQIQGNQLLPYLEYIQPDRVVDWYYDEDGILQWVKMYEEVVLQPSPFDGKQKVFRYTLAWMNDNGFCEWAIYEFVGKNIDDKPSDQSRFICQNDIVTTFEELNVKCYSLDTEMSIGEQIGPMNVEHYQRRSHLTHNSNKTCIAIGVILTGAESNAPGEEGVSEVQKDTSRSARARETAVKERSDGWVELGADDDVKIVEANGNSHKFVSDELKGLDDQMHKRVKLMNLSASNNSKGSKGGQAMKQSGESQKEQRHATSNLLSAYRDWEYNIALDLYRSITIAIKDNFVMWSTSGLSIDDYSEDHTELMNELQAIGVKIPSKTFMKKELGRLAISLVGAECTSNEKQQILDEINEAVDSGELENEDMPEDKQDNSVKEN